MVELLLANNGFDEFFGLISKRECIVFFIRVIMSLVIIDIDVDEIIIEDIVLLMISIGIGVVIVVSFASTVAIVVLFGWIVSGS